MKSKMEDLYRPSRPTVNGFHNGSTST